MDEGSFNRLLEKVRSDYGNDILALVLKAKATIPQFDTIPFDLVSHLLGFTKRSDTLNVMLVCKRWYQATRLETFWRRRIAKRLSLLIPEKEWKEAAIKQLDPFYLKHPLFFLSFEKRLNWLFTHNRFATSFQEKTWRIETGYFPNKSDSSVMHSFFYHFDKKTKNLNQYVYSEHIMGKNGAWETHGVLLWVPAEIGNMQFREELWENGHRISRTVDYKTNEGHHFRGGFRAGLPHGAGKWTFADGTTLTGENVAFQGVPHGKGGQEGEEEYFAGERLIDAKRRKLNEI